MKHIKKIKIDIDKKNFEVIPSVQYDSNTRYLHIQLLNDSVPFDITGCSVILSGVKEDGNSIFNSCDIINSEIGFIQAEVTEQMNAIPGYIDCEIKIYNGEGVLTSKKFTIKVTASQTSREVVSSNEFKALTDALKEVQGIDNKFGEVYEHLDNKTYYINTVCIMKSNNYKDGDRVFTNGYYSENDGGNAQYLIVEDKNKYTSKWIENLNNGLFAVLINSENEVLNVKQCGMRGDGLTDDSDIFSKIITFMKDKIIFVPSGKYMFFKPIKSTVSTNYIIGEEVNPAKPIFNTTIFDFTNCDNENIDLLTFNNITIKNVLIQSNSYSLDEDRDKAIVEENPFTEHINKIGVNGLNIKGANSVVENVKVVGCSGIGLKNRAYSFLDKIVIEQCKLGCQIDGDNQIGKIRFATCYNGLRITGSTNHILDIRMDAIANTAIQISGTGNVICVGNIDYCYENGLKMHDCFDSSISLFMSRVGVCACEDKDTNLTFDSPSSGLKGYPIIMYANCERNKLNITLKRGNISDDSSKTTLSAPTWGVLGFDANTHVDNDIIINSNIVKDISDKISLKRIFNNIGYNGYLTLNSNQYHINNLDINNVNTCFKTNDSIIKEKTFLSNVDVFQTMGDTIDFKIIEFGSGLTNAPESNTFFVCLQICHRAIAFTINGIYMSIFSGGSWRQWVKIAN